MGLSEWLGVIGIALSGISIIIGLCAHSKINKFVNKEIKDSTIVQGENITITNSGSDAYAIMKIAKDVTREEMEKVVKRLETLKQEVQKVQIEWEDFPEKFDAELEKRTMNEDDIKEITGILEGEGSDGQA